MLTDQIIGRVGFHILRQSLGDVRPEIGAAPDSAALFRLDKLASPQIAAVAREILADPEFSARIEVKLPRALVEGQDLPAAVLTSMNAGGIRNVGTSREALLMANGNEHNIADTLGHVTALGAREMRSNAEAWVAAVCHVKGLALAPEDAVVFRSALKGLTAAWEPSLQQLGDYCAHASEALGARQYPIREALGWALPWISLPRDTSYFSSAKTYAKAETPWRKAFEKLFSKRAPLLNRMNPTTGQPLDPADLRARLQECIETKAIPEHAQGVLWSFIDASSVDRRQTSEELALLEWEKDGVHLLFDKLREKKRQGLAQATLDFFEGEFPDVLGEQSKRHLEDLRTREKRSDWNEEDEAFFERHRRYMEQDARLHLSWEKIVFDKPVECHDFFEGFATAVQRLVASSDEARGERFMRLKVAKGRTEWRERFNHDVGAFFSVLYRGFKEQLGGKADWKVEKMGTIKSPDPLFDYPAFFAAERERMKDKPPRPCVSVARKSVEIKFEAALVERIGDSENVLGKTQILWAFRPESIGLSLWEDLGRLSRKGGLTCATEVSRRLVSKKGGVQSVSLLDVNTLEAVFRSDAGSLTPPTEQLRSLRAEITRRLKELVSEGWLTPEARERILAAFLAFEADYARALDDFMRRGLHTEAILRQADSFKELLRTLGAHARGDVCRARLVAEILGIGVVQVLGEQPSVIVAPWHPERLKSLAVKTRRVAGLVTHLLESKKVHFGDRNVFFQGFAEELAHPFYPEIAIARRGGAHVLVSESSTVNGYSLLERPVRGEGESFTDVDPAEAARQARDLLKRYVELQPHEASSLSVLLYNADAAALPLAVVRELIGIQGESGFQGNVSVLHREPEALRRIYAELVSRTDGDPDVPIVSETSENFMSKLRISVVRPATTPARSGTGFRPFDVAFLHDVVSRTAAEEWLPVEWSEDRPDLEHAPSRWSYRDVSGENELKSTTFLTCPRQTSTGWAYVDALASVLRQQDAPPGARFLPARRISLQNERLRELLTDVHDLAEWVATYDELLDKRQLQANRITVVRYRRASTNGRNMIVSSTSELRLLGVLLRRRLDELGLALDGQALDETAGRMKKDALSISGDIVLRAAKRGVSAGELLGLVLSRFLVEREFHAVSGAGARPAFSVFFLLDDYAAWLSQKEARIADLLGLCVEESDGEARLHVAVVESKYVAAAGLADARRSSKEQMLTTLSTFRDALFGDPGRLDRDLWLARLADLLLDAEIPNGCTELLDRVRSRLRDGEAKISLRGYSHVFVHTPEPGGCSEQRLLIDSADVLGYQEVFDRPELRRLVEAYVHGRDPAEIRAKLGPDSPWLNASPRLPAPRVVWTTNPGVQRANGPLAGAGQSPAIAEVESTARKVGSAHARQRAVGPLDSPLGVPRRNTLGVLVEERAAVAAGVDGREAWRLEMVGRLTKALRSYDLRAEVLGSRLTPNGCLVRLAGSDRLRVGDIDAKRTQMLTTHALSLVTVQPRPGEIVVTLAGERRQSVSLWDLWSRRQLNRNAAGINTSFVLGLQELNGEILYLNLGGEFGGLSAHEPHSLIAGATGSGKSVLIQALLLDIAASNPSGLAQILLIDPKLGVDYAALGALPHLREPIITSRERAAQVLAELVSEMETRYHAFAAAGARDLSAYNAKSASEARLPMLFLVHDEFADWMLDGAYKSAVSAAVQRLGVKSRAAGIHLIFAAQRPDKDVMPMQLRDNLGNRLILKVASEATSKIVLDRPGAELLLGKGHLAAKLSGEQELVFAQAPFLSDEDIATAVEAIRAEQE